MPGLQQVSGTVLCFTQGGSILVAPSGRAAIKQLTQSKPWAMLSCPVGARIVAAISVSLEIAISDKATRFMWSILLAYGG